MNFFIQRKGNILKFLMGIQICVCALSTPQNVTSWYLPWNK